MRGRAGVVIGIILIFVKSYKFICMGVPEWLLGMTRNHVEFGAWLVTRPFILSISLPPIIGSSIRLASDATIARALSSLATTVRSRECCTAGLTMINSSRELAALTKASKELRKS